MGASAMAAIVIKRERQLVDHFHRAVVRAAAPGRYSLDEPSWEAQRAQRALRRRVATVMLMIGLVVVVWTLYTSRR
jgi:cell division septal protein FtsQ